MVVALAVRLPLRRPREVPIRVVCVGLGAMGTGVARLLRERAGYEIVAAVDPNPQAQLDSAVGRIATTVSALEHLRADVCVICTRTRFREVRPDVEWAVSRGMNVVTCAEEGLPYPWASYPVEAAELDALARRHGVTVLGTGVNPGFAMDVLPILLTTACRNVRRIEVHRANDLSGFGAGVMTSFGIGMWPEEYQSAREAGAVVGHTGFIESISMIAAATGLEVDEIRCETRPIVAKATRTAPRATAPPGTVAGCIDIGEGLGRGQVVIRLEHPQQIDPAAEGAGTCDRIKIDGDPSLSLLIEPEIGGGPGTIAVLANMIPSVIDAPPGLTTMDRLRLPAGAFA